MPTYTITAKINARILRFRGVEYIPLLAFQRMIIDIQNQLINNNAGMEARAAVSVISDVLAQRTEN